MRSGMRALLIDYERRDLREGDVAEPAIRQEDQVLFRILEAGVCGTDRELASFRFGYSPPGESSLVIGHEAAGQVIAAGRAASALFAPGDIVVPAVRRSCSPACASCARGRRDLCLTGGYTERGIFGAHGYFTELAVDRAQDLVKVPGDCAAFAVLVEPLSVVEKAVDRALSLHQGEPHRALVLGAGTIGILATMVLRIRGLEVDLVSVEPADSHRARLAESAGARYLNRPDRATDIVIEAAGAAEAAHTGLAALAPLGVLIVLGATETREKLDLLNMIIGNRILAGSVNASPQSFAQAAADLGRLDTAILRSMIDRRLFREYRQSLTGPPPTAPKIVHSIAQ